jgi:hypothetical protein
MGNTVAQGVMQRPATLVRLNPSIQPVLTADNSRWIPPPGLTRKELNTLMTLPAALLTDDAVARVKTLGQKWIEGLVPNQPIRRSHNLGCLTGDPTFEVGSARWQRLDMA